MMTTAVPLHIQEPTGDPYIDLYAACLLQSFQDAESDDPASRYLARQHLLEMLGRTPLESLYRQRVISWHPDRISFMGG